MGEAPAEKTGIQEAVEKAGDQKTLAAQLGVTQQNVSWWVGRGFVPLDRAVEIEAQYGVDRRRLVDPKLVDLLS